MNFHFYPPNPPNPPNVFFMIRKILIKIRKEWEMVRKKVRGVVRGVRGVNYSNSTFRVLKYFIKLSKSIVVLELLGHLVIQTKPFIFNCFFDT